MLSPSLQDYLEEMYRLSINQDHIRVSDIAEVLNVSLPSVVKALHKLDEERYVEYKPYECIILTKQGKKEGHFLVQRNKILKDFLQVLESDCNIVQEAEAMEHYLSYTTIQSIEKFVHFMQVKPDIRKQFQEFCKKSDKDYWFS